MVSGYYSKPKAGWRWNQASKLSSTRFIMREIAYANVARSHNGLSLEDIQIFAYISRRLYTLVV